MKKAFSEKNDLAVEIAFLQSLRAEMPKDVELLKVLGDDLTKVGRFREGLEIDLELSKLEPHDPVIYYNLACSFSLLGQLKESADALIRAIQHGYCEWDWLRCDSDLKNLRDSEEFDSVRPFIDKKTKRVA
jgi:predicted Zn-dependent protease